MHSSPFMLDTGQHPWLSVEPLICLETLKDFTSRMNKATDEASLALSQAADGMARFYNAHWREAPLYEVRDRVWLNGQNITMTQPMKKYKWLRPYSVKKVISQSA